MSFKTTLLAAGLAVFAALPAVAGSKMMVHDGYARTSMMGAKTGAAFMQIMNHTDHDDRLVSAASDIAKRVELHTHKDMGDGVMKMMHVEEGFAIPAGETLSLERGGKHVMFMGLTRGMEQGDSVEVTLTFEHAGDVVVEIPVDLERKGGMAHGDHGKMDHSDHKKDDHSGHDH